jgi:F0F1-type ATP synthase membrane subunit b/b'
MRQTITVDSSAVIESVTAEIYTAYADLKVQFERSIDESVNLGKTELVAEMSKLVGKLDEMVSKLIKRSIDESVSHCKTELVAETSQLVGKLDEMVSKIVEDKVSSFVRSEVSMEAVIEAVKARLTPDMVMTDKPWWKWW